MLRFAPNVRAQVSSMPPQARQAIRKALDDVDASAARLDVKALRGNFRAPLQRLALGAWRAAFYTDGEITYVVRVFRRADRYDWLADWEMAT